MHKYLSVLSGLIICAAASFPVHAQDIATTGSSSSAASVAIPPTTLDTSTANRGAGLALSNGNLTVTQNSGDGSHYQSVQSKAGYISGKYYFEASVSGTLGNFCIGISNGFVDPSGVAGNCGFYGFTSAAFFPGTAGLYTNSAELGSTPIGSSGHTYGFAVDLSAGLMWMRDVTASSVTWNAGGTANPATGVGGYSITGLTLYCPCFPYFAIDTTTNSITANFGATAFAATAPSGFLPWPDNGTIPAAANAVGYNIKTHYETWASTATIDTTNSLALGFNWYINSTFPNLFANGSQYQGFIDDAPVYPSNDFSVSSNLLTLSIGANNWSNFSTCYWDGAAVSGKTFGGGFYADAFMKAGTTGGGSVTSTPAWWFFPKEYLNGSITTGSFVELDGWESAYGMHTHDWNVFNSPDTSNDNNLFSGSVSTYQDNVLHHYSVLWIPQVLSNQGLGTITRYLDGVATGTLVYSNSTVPSPSLSPSNPSGAISEMDNENFCMFLNVAATWPASFGTIQVWQR